MPQICLHNAQCFRLTKILKKCQHNVQKPTKEKIPLANVFTRKSLRIGHYKYGFVFDCTLLKQTLKRLSIGRGPCMGDLKNCSVTNVCVYFMVSFNNFRVTASYRSLKTTQMSKYRVCIGVQTRRRTQSCPLTRVSVTRAPTLPLYSQKNNHPAIDF